LNHKKSIESQYPPNGESLGKASEKFESAENNVVKPFLQYRFLLPGMRLNYNLMTLGWISGQKVSFSNQQLNQIDSPVINF